MKTKKWFAEQVKLALTNEWPNIDDKLDEREVLLRLDATVNELAAKNYFENWKISGAKVDEQFITTFEDVEVVDQENGKPSYFVFPANYAGLPKNAGIVQVYPMRWLSVFEPPVSIISHEEYRRFLSNPAANMQGRLCGYPKNGSRYFYFTSCDVGKKYGPMGMSLVIRDSSQIADDAPYGIPADKENFLIATVVAWYRARREVPSDSVRDNKDQV